MEQKTSPEYVRTSLAASLTLGLREGQFHRNAKLKGLNLLLHYEEGCVGRCHFCGLSKSRRRAEEKTFIRVDWPLFPLEEIIRRTSGNDRIHRICISMITHPRAVADTLHVIEKIRDATDLPVSVLISPTPIHDAGPLEAMKRAGADRVGIAIDAATPELFDRLRGRGAGGPHRWEHYWDIVRMSAAVFGKFHAGIHLIVGLGETEKEMVEAIQRGQDMDCYTHLFSFFPEKGSPMEDHDPPPVDRYRRIQLARWIINEGIGSMGQPALSLSNGPALSSSKGPALSLSKGMKFDPTGKLIDFGMDIGPLVRSGEPFMTSGCPGRDGKVACNRPYGNERPSGPIRNFPFEPEPEDIEEILKQIGKLKERNTGDY